MGAKRQEYGIVSDRYVRVTVISGSDAVDRVIGSDRTEQASAEFQNGIDTVREFAMAIQKLH